MICSFSYAERLRATTTDMRSCVCGGILARYAVLTDGRCLNVACRQGAPS